MHRYTAWVHRVQCFSFAQRGTSRSLYAHLNERMTTEVFLLALSPSERARCCDPLSTCRLCRRGLTRPRPPPPCTELNYTRNADSSVPDILTIMPSCCPASVTTLGTTNYANRPTALLLLLLQACSGNSSSNLFFSPFYCFSLSLSLRLLLSAFHTCARYLLEFNDSSDAKSDRE